MQEAIITSLIFMFIVAIVVSIITVIRVKKNPEAFEKQSNAINEQLSSMKESMTGNRITWEEAKRQAAAELAAEAKIKEEKKASKKKNN